jgi:hypothetical protein
LDRAQVLIARRNKLPVSGNRMTTTMKIIIGLILTTFWACNSTTHKDNQATDNGIQNNSVSIITFIDGHYQIDTTTILTNNNLQPLIDNLEKSDLTEKKTVSETPIFIKSFLDNLTDSFSIANPGENWQVGCIIDEPLPARQLIYFGLGSEMALMTYYTGGIGKSEHILIFKFNENKIIDFWCGNILTDVTDKTEIINYLKTNKDKDWGLNTNIIYL